MKGNEGGERYVSGTRGMDIRDYNKEKTGEGHTTTARWWASTAVKGHSL